MTEYVILYTHQKQKKAKTWQDGCLKILSTGKKAVIYDDKKNKIDTIFLKNGEVTVGDDIESDRYLIQIESVKCGQPEPTSSSATQADGSSHVQTLSERQTVVTAGSNSGFKHAPRFVGLKRKKTGFNPPRLVKPKVEEHTNVEDNHNPSVTAFPQKHVHSTPGHSSFNKVTLNSQEYSHMTKPSQSLISSSSSLASMGADKVNVTDFLNVRQQEKNAVEKAMSSPWSIVGKSKLKSFQTEAINSKSDLQKSDLDSDRKQEVMQGIPFSDRKQEVAHRLNFPDRKQKIRDMYGVPNSVSEPVGLSNMKMASPSSSVEAGIDLQIHKDEINKELETKTTQSMLTEASKNIPEKRSASQILALIAVKGSVKTDSIPADEILTSGNECMTREQVTARSNILDKGITKKSESETRLHIKEASAESDNMTCRTFDRFVNFPSVSQEESLLQESLNDDIFMSPKTTTGNDNTENKTDYNSKSSSERPITTSGIDPVHKDYGLREKVDKSALDNKNPLEPGVTGSLIAGISGFAPSSDLHLNKGAENEVKDETGIWTKTGLNYEQVETENEPSVINYNVQKIKVTVKMEGINTDVEQKGKINVKMEPFENMQTLETSGSQPCVVDACDSVIDGFWEKNVLVENSGSQKNDTKTKVIETMRENELKEVNTVNEAVDSKIDKASFDKKYPLTEEDTIESLSQTNMQNVTISKEDSFTIVNSSESVSQIKQMEDVTNNIEEIADLEAACFDINFSPFSDASMSDYETVACEGNESDKDEIVCDSQQLKVKDSSMDEGEMNTMIAPRLEGFLKRVDTSDKQLAMGKKTRVEIDLNSPGKDCLEISEEDNGYRNKLKTENIVQNTVNTTGNRGHLNGDSEIQDSEELAFVSVKHVKQDLSTVSSNGQLLPVTGQSNSDAKKSLLNNEESKDTPLLEKPSFDDRSNSLEMVEKSPKVNKARGIDLPQEEICTFGPIADTSANKQAIVSNCSGAEMTEKDKSEYGQAVKSIEVSDHSVPGSSQKSVTGGTGLFRLSGINMSPDSPDYSIATTTKGGSRDAELFKPFHKQSGLFGTENSKSALEIGLNQKYAKSSAGEIVNEAEDKSLLKSKFHDNRVKKEDIDGLCTDWSLKSSEVNEDMVLNSLLCNISKKDTLLQDRNSDIAENGICQDRNKDMCSSDITLIETRFSTQVVNSTKNQAFNAPLHEELSDNWRSQTDSCRTSDTMFTFSSDTESQESSLAQGIVRKLTTVKMNEIKDNPEAVDSPDKSETLTRDFAVGRHGLLPHPSQLMGKQVNKTVDTEPSHHNGEDGKTLFERADQKLENYSVSGSARSVTVRRHQETGHYGDMEDKRTIRGEGFNNREMGCTDREVEAKLSPDLDGCLADPAENSLYYVNPEEKIRKRFSHESLFMVTPRDVFRHSNPQKSSPVQCVPERSDLDLSASMRPLPTSLSENLDLPIHRQKRREPIKCQPFGDDILRQDVFCEEERRGFCRGGQKKTGIRTTPKQEANVGLPVWMCESPGDLSFTLSPLPSQTDHRSFRSTYASSLTDHRSIRSPVPSITDHQSIRSTYTSSHIDHQPTESTSINSGTDHWSSESTCSISRGDLSKPTYVSSHTNRRSSKSTCISLVGLDSDSQDLTEETRDSQPSKGFMVHNTISQNKFQASLQKSRSDAYNPLIGHTETPHDKITNRMDNASNQFNRTYLTHDMQTKNDVDFHSDKISSTDKYRTDYFGVDNADNNPSSSYTNINSNINSQSTACSRWKRFSNQSEVDRQELYPDKVESVRSQGTIISDIKNSSQAYGDWSRLNKSITSTNALSQSAHVPYKSAGVPKTSAPALRTGVDHLVSSSPAVTKEIELTSDMSTDNDSQSLEDFYFDVETPKQGEEDKAPFGGKGNEFVRGVITDQMCPHVGESENARRELGLRGGYRDVRDIDSDKTIMSQQFCGYVDVKRGGNETDTYRSSQLTCGKENTSSRDMTPSYDTGRDQNLMIEIGGGEVQHTNEFRLSPVPCVDKTESELDMLVTDESIGLNQWCSSDTDSKQRRDYRISPGSSSISSTNNQSTVETIQTNYAKNISGISSSMNNLNKPFRKHSSVITHSAASSENPVVTTHGPGLQGRGFKPPTPSADNMSSNTSSGLPGDSRGFNVPASRVTENSVVPSSQRNLCGDLHFPSRAEAEGNVSPCRQITIPVSFSSMSSYKQVLKQALQEYLNVQLFELSKHYHSVLSSLDLSSYSPVNTDSTSGVVSASGSGKSHNPPCDHGQPSKIVQVKKEGHNKGRFFFACNNGRDNQCKFFKWADQTTPGKSNPTASSGSGVQKNGRGCGLSLTDGASIGTFFKGRGIHLYCESVFIRKVPDSFRSQKNKIPAWVKKRQIEETQSQSKKIYIALSRRENSAMFAKDDLWVISRQLTFDPGCTFVARSVFYGPSSNNEVEVELLTGFCPSNWQSQAPCHALHASNAASELTCLTTLQEFVKPACLPVLPALLNLHSSQPTGGLHRPTSKPMYYGPWENIACLTEEFVREHGLNVYQAEALRRVVGMFQSEGGTQGAPQVTLIHGVFGAGKSFLLAVIVKFIVKLSELRDLYTPGVPEPLKLLVSSTTNVAVDCILLGLLDLGFDQFVRVGSVKKIAKPILPYSMHAAGTDSQEMRELQEMLKSDISASEKGHVKKRMDKLRRGDNKRQLAVVRVVGVTCAACPFPSLKGFCFSVVILDECSQITEPASLLPIARFGSEKLVLVGDPNQLDPTLEGSEAAHTHGLEQTLFDRLTRMGHAATVLRMQYRCHPKISAVSNHLFYGGQLCDGVTAEQRKPLMPDLPTLCFYDVANGRESCGSGGSFSNAAEAGFVVMVIEALVTGGVEPEDIGVITLYRAQQETITRALRESSLSDASELRSIQISTVDAFQGGERNVIILSCVRTNSSGFIDNDKRTNVALSRSRHHLLIVGSKRNLSRNRLWAKVLGHCTDLPDGCSTSELFRQRFIESAPEKVRNSVLTESQSSRETDKQTRHSHMVSEDDKPPTEQIPVPASPVVRANKRKHPVLNDKLFDESDKENSSDSEDLPIGL